MALTAILLSTVLGAGTFLYERHHAERRIVALAQSEATALAALLAQRGDPAGPADPAGQRELPQDLRTALNARSHAAGGHFIAAELVDAHGTVIARAGEPGAAMASTGTPPPSGESLFEAHWAAGAVHVTVTMPRSMDGGRAGALRGAFRLDDVALTDLVDAVVRAVVITVAVVLITSAVLYPVILAMQRTLLRRNRDLLEANISVLDVLGRAVAKRDTDTHAHNHRVTLYAVRLAEAAGLSAPAIAGLVKGALLHDVGKIGVSDAILLKPGRLTVDEFTAMKRHVGYGLEIVGDTPWLADAAAVIGGHHERWDGSGYPHGLRQDAIPVSARIFAIADVFDALTSRRPYKDPIPVGDAVAMLAEESGRHFDPHLLTVFIGLCRPLFETVSRADEMALRATVWSLAGQYLTLGAAGHHRPSPEMPTPAAVPSAIGA